MDPRTFVALDLETTGLNPKRDAIIEFGAVRFQSGSARERLTSYVNPGRPIPLRIQQITGIRPADVVDAPSLEKLTPEILAFIGGRTDAIVAHSAGFDISFLRAAGVQVHRPVLDTYELATILLPAQDSYSLGELCRALAIPLPTAHRAAHDAEATADLMARLLQEIEALPTATLETLCAAGAESDWGAMLLFQDALRRRRRSASPPARSAVFAPAPAMAAPIDLPWPPQEEEQERATADISDSLIADEFLTAAFAEDGPLAAEFDRLDGATPQQLGIGAPLNSARFERRDGQLEMARQALDALNRGDHKIIEAGTGTGKSLAYLLPAAAWAMVNDSRVVIATNTIPLQDQLLERELPRVLQALAATNPAEARAASAEREREGQSPNGVSRPPVRAMALKGRSHYLCTRRLARWLGNRALSPLELRFLAKILVWLPHTQTGDISELAMHDRREQALPARVSSLADECSPERCMAWVAPGQPNNIGHERFWDFYLQAHRQAKSAHLLVVNHALLLADVETNGQVLPAYDNLIVDEAHHLESAATEQFTQRVDLRTLASLVTATEPDRDVASLLAAVANRTDQQGLAPPGRSQGGESKSGTPHRWLWLARQLAADRRPLQTSIPDFFKALLDFVRRHSEMRPKPGYPQRLALDNRMRAQPDWSEIEIKWDEVSMQIGQLLSRLAELADALDAAHWWLRERAADVAPYRGAPYTTADAAPYRGARYTTADAAPYRDARYTPFAQRAKPESRAEHDIEGKDAGPQKRKESSLKAKTQGEMPELAEREAGSRFLQALHRAHANLAGMLQVADDVILRPLHIQEQSVAWLELNDKADAVMVCSAPVQVSEKLAADLFRPRRAVVLTGATLQAGDRFDFLRDRLGCWDASGTVIDSPFDYKRNVLLYMPSDMPTPDRHNYQQALEQAILQTALAAGGRTLVLFTSHSQLRATAEAVRAPLAAAGLPVLQQGEGSRRRNLRDFRANPRAILLGTSSYWEGIDLPGEQLVCLLIARLPFAVPSDPLFAARSRLYEDAFHEYAVPDAIIRLRQGFGRLIRSATDRGVVVLLDSRLWQRRYGEVFLDALPACATRHSPLSHLEESVRNWLSTSALQ